MALTKTVTDDKLEVVGDFKDLQIRTEIRGITSAVWTNAVKAAKKAANEAASI